VSKPIKAEDLLAVLRKWANPTTEVPPRPDSAASNASMAREQRSEPALDAEAFIALQALYGDEDPTALRSLIELFIRDATARVATLRAAVDTSDATALERAAHGLTSSSATVGALGMAELCGTLQTLGRSGSLTGAGPLVEQLSVEFNRVQQALSHACAAA
jgi:two-component system, sensor histidine kinase and response regulator